MKINLFKYCPPTFGNSPNLAFYEKKAIFFQAPHNFNDPFEFKYPHPKIRKKRKQLKELNEKMFLRRGPEFAANIWNNLNKHSTSEIQRIMANNFVTALDNRREEMGIYSTSLIPDSELIWSHYSVSHTGYMLQFELDIMKYMSDPLFPAVIPIPVIYSKSRAVTSIDQYYEDQQKVVFDLVRTKSSAWQYEYEVRLLHPTFHGFLKLPDGFLKSIVLGARIDPKLKQELTSVCKELDIPIYSAKLDEKKYKINIPGLKVDGKTGVDSHTELLKSRILELRDS